MNNIAAGYFTGYDGGVGFGEDRDCALRWPSRIAWHEGCASLERRKLREGQRGSPFEHQPAYELRLRLETVQDATSDTGRPDEHGQISCISMGHCKRERMLVVGLLVVPHVGITEGVGFGRRSAKGGVKANRAREATVLFCDRHVFGQAIARG